MKPLNKNATGATPDWLNRVSKKGARTPVSQLKTGMFVAELDRPWMGTPFLTQGVLIDHPDIISTLAEYCQYVFVTEAPNQSKHRRDTLVKPIPSLAQKASRPVVFSAPPSVSDRQAKGRKSSLKKKASIKKKQDSHYQIQLSAEKEHPAARKAYAQAKLALENIVIAAQYGSKFDIHSAESVVRVCRESVVRNPNALLWMSRAKHDSSYIVKHGLSVSILAMVFGRNLNFTESELDVLGLCGLLHDIGKVKIPANIQNKQGSLSSDELRLIKQHTIDGYKMLRDNKAQIAKLIDVTLNHHERPDGKGYPRNLKGHEISDYAKIIAVVEAFDAMTSDRIFAKAKGPADAHKEVYENLGKQFDEEYALQFMQTIGPYPPGTVLELRNGMVGVVLTAHPKFRHLPTVILSSDVDKQAIDDKITDLSLTDSGKLDKGFLVQRTLPDGSFGVSLENYKLGAGDNSLN